MESVPIRTCQEGTKEMKASNYVNKCSSQELKGLKNVHNLMSSAWFQSDSLILHFKRFGQMEEVRLCHQPLTSHHALQSP